MTNPDRLPVSFALPFNLSISGWLTVFITLVSLSVGAQAQTAHFSGIVTTVGSGFSKPYGVAVDGSGNVYIADSGNNAVTKMPSGCASFNCVTMLNGGFIGPLSVAVDSNGNVFVLQFGDTVVREMPASCTSPGCVTPVGGGFNFPTSVAVDSSGTVYVADGGNSAVKMMLATCTSSSCVTALGGGFNQPYGVAVDGSGNVFVADTENSKVKEIPAGCTAANYSSSLCTVTTLGGGFNKPIGIAVDSEGSVFVSDQNLSAVDEIPAGCNSSSCVLKMLNDFDMPFGVAVDANENIYVGNSVNGTVNKLALHANFGTAAIATSAPVSVTVPFIFDTPGTIGQPQVLTQGTSGLDFTDAGTGSCTMMNGASYPYPPGGGCTVVVNFSPRSAGTRYGAVVLTNSSGTPIATAYIYGSGDGPQAVFLPGTQVNIPPTTGSWDLANSVAVDGKGDLFISNGQGNNAVELPWTGSSYGTQSTIGTGLTNPGGIAVDGAGNIFIADANHSRVVEVPWTGSGYGTQTTVPTTNLNFPTGLAVDTYGNVYIADELNNSVLEVPWTGTGYGTQITLISSGLSYPDGLAVDSNGAVYIADYGNNRILKLSASGSQTDLGSGLNAPSGVTVDGSGNVYISDTSNDKIVEIPWTGSGYGTQFTLVGHANGPFGLATDSNGNLYFAVPNDNLITELVRATPSTIAFATPTAINQTDSTDGAQTVSLENIGTEPLSIVIPASGKNPAIGADFSLNSTGSTKCPLVTSGSTSAGLLAVGGTCDLTVSFGPVAAGPLSESLVITDTNLDANPSTTQSVTLTGTTPLTATTAVPVATATENRPYNGPNPVTASGGFAPVHYTVSPLLPAGVSMSNTTGVISGFPTNPASAQTYTVTVTDATNATATAQFSFAVDTSVTASLAISSMSLTQNNAASSFIPVTGANGTSPLSYSVSPMLPSGLSLNASTGAITGTASGTYTASNFTVTVTDAVNATASKMFSLTVNSAVTATQAVPTVTLTALSAATPFTPVTGSGGTPSLNYSVAPPLPANLSMSNSTGIVSGTPNAPSPAATYTVTVTDANGANASNTFSLTVNQAAQSINFTAPTTPVTYGVSPITLVATGGDSGNAVIFTVASGPCTIATGATTVTITGVGSCAINANQAGNTNYAAASQVQKAIVVDQAAVSIAVSAITQVYGSTSSGTITVSGVSGGTTPSGSVTYAVDSGTPTAVNLSSGQAPYAIPSLTGGGHTFSVSYSGDTNYAVSASATVVNFAVTPASTVTTIAQIAPLTSGVGTGVSTTFSATVTGTPGTPMGQVQFSDNGNPIGSAVRLTGGVATLTTTFATTGSHPITATYLGSMNFATSTTTPSFNEMVSTPSYTAAANQNSLTITRGTTGTLAITLTPTGNYTGAASFSCDNLPEFVSCAFVPSSVTFDGTNTVQMVAVTIYTLGPANIGAARSPAGAGFLWLPGILLGSLLLFARKRVAQQRRMLCLLMLTLCTAAMLSGCGSGPSKFYSPQGTDQVSINVTGTGTAPSGNVNQSATVSLTIQ